MDHLPHVHVLVSTGPSFRQIVDGRLDSLSHNLSNIVLSVDALMKELPIAEREHTEVERLTQRLIDLGNRLDEAERALKVGNVEERLTNAHKKSEGKPVRLNERSFPSEHRAALDLCRRKVKELRSYYWLEKGKRPGSIDADRLCKTLRCEAEEAKHCWIAVGNAKDGQERKGECKPPAGVQQDGNPADGTLKDSRIWLKGKPYRLTTGLRKLLNFILEPSGASVEAAIKHCGFSGQSHLHKTLKDLRNRLDKEVKKDGWNLQIKTEHNHIYCKWVQTK